MGKNRNLFVCQECGFSTAKWLGKCPGCSQWNTFLEESIKEKGRPLRTREPIVLANLTTEQTGRLSSGIRELDRVLGGGITPGSLVLLGGDPGIGKSTLLLQMAEGFSQQGKNVLYLSGEESPGQVKMRATRLGLKGDNIFFLNETNLGMIKDYIKEIKPGVVIIDSIQTVYIPEISSVPGSISQLKESTARLMEIAKQSELPVFLVGHVTKEGSLAGPRVLEHMVDTVIYFEGDNNNYYRILRAVKNRFGSVNEIGILEMSASGLLEVENPSRVFLGDTKDMLPGSAVVTSFEGSRAILVEVEALVVATSYGYPRRMAMGIDVNRLSLIAAVLEKRAELTLGNKDIYLKVAGGTVVKDPATDLGIAAAIISSHCDRRILADSVFIGEVGLSGEIRSVPFLDGRLKEAEKMGFQRVLIPAEKRPYNLSDFSLEIIELRTLDEVFEYL